MRVTQAENGIAENQLQPPQSRQRAPQTRVIDFFIAQMRGSKPVRRSLNGRSAEVVATVLHRIEALAIFISFRAPISGSAAGRSARGAAARERRSEGNPVNAPAISKKHNY
jgi:hypothetical protein